MKMEVPVFVVTTARVEGGKHHVFISKEIEMDNTGDFEADLVRNVQKANDKICETIRKHPDQWVWMHRRWRTAPAKGGIK
jgi:KDO2-lipid IV(A) lauroyltransferase